MTFTQRLSHFTPTIWIIIFGTFLTRLTFFMVWPFLAIILYQKFGLSEGKIGLILSISAGSGTLLGFFAGNLSDRIGRKNIMVFGGLLNITGFCLMAIADTINMYIWATLFCGIARAFLEPPGKALISDATDNQQVREFAFHARYFMLNVGAAIGPIVGLYFGLTAQQETFWLTASAYVLYSAAIIVVVKHRPGVRPANAENDHKLSKTMKILASDRAFMVMVIANLLIMLTYSQIEATLIQFINLFSHIDATHLYTWLITTNALTIIIFQFPMLKLLERMALSHRVIIGSLLFGLSFSAFAIIPVESPTLWILNMVILSLGETVLFPTLNLQIDRMAPSHLKGSYFGAAGLAGFGFALGPLTGGMLLEYFQSGVIWYFFGGLQVVVIFMYFKSINMKRPTFEVEKH